MNRFLLTGMLLDAARQSSRIGYIGRSSDAREALALCDDEKDALFDVARIYRTDGRERIELRAAGSISFFRTLAATRGLPFDVLLIDRHIIDRLDLAELHSHLATHGEVIPL